MARKPKRKRPIARGLNAADYHRLRRRIAGGQMTWAEAEKLGLCHSARTAQKPLGRPIQTGRVASTPKGAT